MKSFSPSRFVGAIVVTVAVLSEGDFFGEGACLLNRPQQASVFAQTDCTLLAIDRQVLDLGKAI